jgi:uncharacterized protein (DUF1684 family)
MNTPTVEPSGRQIALALLCAALLPAFGAAQPPDTVTSFASAHAAWVKEREAELTQPDGWTSLIGLHWLDAGPQRVGSADGNEVRLRIGPATLGTVEERGGATYFTPTSGADVTLDGAPLRGEVRLEPEGRVGGTKLTYDDGKGRITVIERSGRRALRVRHADSPDRLRFKGLQVFPPDERWRVKAKFVPHPPGSTLPIVNILGDVTDTPNPGAVEFLKDGRTWRLEAARRPTEWRAS